MAAAEPPTNSREARRRLTGRLFPEAVPRLWCPTLTHFTAQHQFDAPRLRRHWQQLAPFVKGALVPGSTGEGWDMSDANIRDLLSVVLDIAQATDIRVLIGILKTDLAGMMECLETTLSFLQRRAGTAIPEEVLERSNVVGFTVCPPKGSHFAQDEIAEALDRVAGRGVPLALYQLPQITGNEMSPETVQALARRHPNFFLFKDTSGNDRVAQSELDLDGVFLVRGAEGGYARWPRSAGGPYDGFLLSTANVFARELDAMLTLLDQGRPTDADELAARLSRVVESCFELVRGFPTGNAFTHVNKLLDHLMAHGASGLRREPPLLHGGVRLPASWIERAAELLRRNGLMPASGYME
jgi:dihydrodipicolinate synthase/N-acetylneuraminate lyase